jgi:hypothetical protein
MKKLVFSALCFLSCRSVLGQNFNRADHDGKDVTLNMVGINSKSFYLQKSTGVPYCCPDGVDLVGSDVDGKVIFRTLIAGGPYMDYSKVCISADKRLIAYTGTLLKHCDTGGPYFTVSKVDTTGATIWTFTLTTRVLDMQTRFDGSFDLFFATQINHYSSTGQFITQIPLGIAQLKSGSFLDNNTIALSYMGALGPRMKLMDTLGTLISDIAMTSTITNILKDPNGIIYSISGPEIQKYSLSFNLLCASFTAQPGVFFTSFHKRNDSIFATGQTIGNPFFMIMDTVFNALYASNSNVENAVGTGIYVGKNNKVNVITTGIKTHSFAGFFQTAINGDLDAKPDIGVIRTLLLDSTILPDAYNSWIVQLKAGVTVKNFGTDTVKNFHLNFYSAYGGIQFCMTGLQERFNKTIAPGDTVTVITQNFKSQHFFNNSLNALNEIYMNICLYTTVPNELNDLDVSNDEACKIVSAHIVGLEELRADNNYFLAYPNPATDKLEIDHVQSADALKIFDSKGKQVKEITKQNLHSEIDVKDLCPGIYFLLINTDVGTINRKFVVQR